MIKNIEKIQKTYLKIIKTAFDLPRNVSTNQLLDALGAYSVDNLAITKSIQLIEKFNKFLKMKKKEENTNIFYQTNKNIWEIINNRIEWNLEDNPDISMKNQIARAKNDGIDLFRGIKIFNRFHELFIWN